MKSAFPVGMMTRRSLLVGGSAFLLSACDDGGKGTALASAAKGDRRQEFVETLAWMSGPGAFSIAFAPYRLSDTERRDVLATGTIYPTLERRLPMLHMKVETTGEVIRSDLIKSIEIIFWHYDPLPTVIKEQVAGNAGSSMSFTDLSGAVRKGGYAIGTIRGQKIVESKTAEKPASFTWNLGFQVSLA